MHATTDNQPRIGANGISLLRILIASYFIALALGIIPGTDFTLLTGLIAEPPVASVLTAVLIFSLSYMVMIGYRTRAAALTLATFTFFAAFVAYVGPTGTGELGAFWRDIALVAGLMLTYPEQSRRRASKRRGRVAAKVNPRRVATKPATTPRPAEPAMPPAYDDTATASVADLSEARARKAAMRPTDLRAPLASDEIDNIFLDYAEAR